MQCWIAVVPSADTHGVSRSSWATYSYESDDRRKRQISAGDLLFLRDQTRLLAAARVENVVSEKREQMVGKCPVCGLAEIGLRKKRDIPYRCFHGHEFLRPVESTHSIIVHTAHFTRECVRIAAQIEAAELRPFELTNSRHMKLKICDISGLCDYIARRDHTVLPVLKNWLKSRAVDLADTDADAVGELPLSISDAQDRPLQAIRMRRGSTTFRDKLLSRYGQRCMISGCSVLALLESCHVGPTQRPDDDHPANGLLLRSDLHTLFDLNLIGLNPSNLEVAVHDSLVGTEYQKFAGTNLILGGCKGIDMRALRARWEQFMSKFVLIAISCDSILSAL
jgi:putative restriction endonuclease